MSDYFEFIPEITEKAQLKSLIEQDEGVIAQENRVYQAYQDWWALHAPNLAKLPQTREVMTLRQDFMTSFVDALQSIGLLDRYKIAGVVASWWDEVRYELRTLTESDFMGLIDSWVETVKDALEEDDDKDDKSKSKNQNKSKFDPLDHKLVKKLLSDYLQEIAEQEGKIAELEQEKEAFERGDEEESEEEETEEGAVNVGKALEDKLKTLKNSIKEEQKQLKALKKKSPLTSQGEIEELTAKVEPIEAEIKEIEVQLKPYKEIKKRINAAKKELTQLKKELITRLEKARGELTPEDCQKLALSILEEGIKTELERAVTAHRQGVIKTVENWWDKYRITLKTIQSERDEAAQKLDGFLRQLGYV
ncbi:MAG: hypothetical protein AB4041_06100 [Microcystaceae cyanobacterium]